MPIDSLPAESATARAESLGGQVQRLLVPARHYARLPALLNGYGIDAGELLAGSGLPYARLHDPLGRLTVAEVEALVLAVLNRLPAASAIELALALGRGIKPSSHEMLGLAMMSAATLAEALQLAERYWPLLTPLLSLQQRREPSVLALRWRARAPLRPPVLQFHAIVVLAAFAEELRFLLGGPANCTIRWPPHWPALPRERLRPALIGPAEEAGAFGIDLPSSLLERPLQLADAAARAAAETRCQALLQELGRQSGLSDWVAALLSGGASLPTLAQVAAWLRLSTRSLQRQLAAEGSHFRQLCNEERHRRACSALQAGHPSLAALAAELGYGDAANFSRAFRRRAGVAPSQWQRQQRRDGLVAPDPG